MKQLVFMVVMTLAGTAGAYVVDPFWGVAVYYLFAVLRPQYMWQWSLPADVSWSYYVAIATIGAALLGCFGVRLGIGSGGADGQQPHRLSLAHYLVLLFGLWVTVTFVTAQNREAAHFWFMEYLKIFVMFAAGTFLTRTVRQVWALFLLTALALAYISYEVNYLYLFNRYLGIFHNGYGGLDNNGAALMLAMGVPLCWFIYEGGGKWWRWAFVALIPVIIHAVLMTYSRGAMVSLLAMCPLLFFRSRQRVRLGLAGLVLGVAIIPALAGAEIRARFLTLENTEADESANSRRGSWMAALRIARDYPVFGVGPRNANLLSYQYGADMQGRTIHSQYFQIMADSGYVGFGLYLAVLVSTCYNTRRVRRLMRGREDAEARRVRAMASGLECSLAVFCVGSAFLSLEVFELPYLLILLAAQLAALSGRAAPDSAAAGADEPLALAGPALPSEVEQGHWPPCSVAR
jgi:probable O-glycosylation ligase (exosortase A-associated)